MAAGVPVWINPTVLEDSESELGDALQMGGTGLWLDQQLFTAQDITGTLEFMGTQIHPLQTGE